MSGALMCGTPWAVRWMVTAVEGGPLGAEAQAPSNIAAARAARAG